LKKEIGRVIDWSQVDKEDYLLAMERSPIKDIEIKHLLKQALTNQENDGNSIGRALTIAIIMRGILFIRQRI